jgi:hypothetical protein
MGDNPEKDIMLSPTWSILEDGLGYNVLVVGGLPRIDSEGREVIEFTVKVDDVVKKRYKLRRGNELNEQDNMKLTVLKHDLIPLNMYDDANKKWLYVKSLLHESTELSQREENLKTIINVKDKRILLLDAENLRLNEQILLFRTNPAMAAAQGAEVFKETMKGIADTGIFKRQGDKE